jgi:hypothetical protein
MKKNIKFTYNDEIGCSTCEIIYRNKRFQGNAFCHADDMDFKSERVGMSIAEARANIKLMRHIRDNEIVPALKTLKHLYENIKNSNKHNSKSHETKMLRRSIHKLEKDLAAINNDIADERKFIKDYIDGKEKLYQRLRAKNK